MATIRGRQCNVTIITQFQCPLLTVVYKLKSDFLIKIKPVVYIFFIITKRFKLFLNVKIALESFRPLLWSCSTNPIAINLFFRKSVSHAENNTYNIK